MKKIKGTYHCYLNDTRFYGSEEDDHNLYVSYRSYYTLQKRKKINGNNFPNMIKDKKFLLLFFIQNMCFVASKKPHLKVCLGNEIYNIPIKYKYKSNKKRIKKWLKQKKAKFII